MVVINPVAQNLELLFGQEHETSIETCYDLESDTELEQELEYEDALVSDQDLLNVYIAAPLQRSIFGITDWSSTQEIDTPPPEPSTLFS